MEDCVRHAVAELFTSCRDGDSSNLQEAVSIATFAAVCFKKEHGAEHTLTLLHTLTEEGVTALLDDASTPHTPSHKFWLAAERLTSSTSHTTIHPLHVLHTSLTHIVPSLSHCALVAVGPREASQLQGVVCDHVTRAMVNGVVPDGIDTLDSLVEAVARVYVITSSQGVNKREVADGGSDIERIVTKIVTKGLKLVHQTYMKCVQEVNSSNFCPTVDCPVQDGECGVILKSVSTLTDSLLLLATIAKITTSVSDVVVETTLSLFNHCLEWLVQTQKSFPGSLPLRSLCVVFASALHLHSVFTELTTQLEFQGHDYSEQLEYSLVDCCDKMRERIESYHIQLCQTCLLQDKDSNDWTSSQPFFEDERCSFSVQMWHYHMHALKHDLCTLLPSSHRPVSTAILREVVSHTLSFMAARYRELTPSCKRVKQAKCDILCILLTVSDLFDHTPLPVGVNQSCTALLRTLSLVLSPLEELQEHLTATSLEEGPPLHTTTDHWRSFLKTCGLPSSTSIYGLGRSDSVCNGVQSSEAEFSHSYCDDRASWPNLLQSLCDNVSLAVRLCMCEGVRPHLIRVLVHVYHSPLTLTQVYTALQELPAGTTRTEMTCTQGGVGGDDCLQAVTTPILDMLQEYVLLGATRIQPHFTDKGGDLEGVLSGLVEEVSQLPSPLLHLIRTLADMQGDKQLPLGGRIAMVLKRILGVWLESLIPRLKEPLVSMVTTYSALLMQNLLGLPWQPSSRTFDMFAQLEELFSEISAATDSVGVASLAEHEVAVRMMERDKDVLRSLKAVCSHLTLSHCPQPSDSSHHPPPSHCPHHPHTSFNPLKTHNTIGGVAIATLMEKTEALYWKELFMAVPLTTSQATRLVARRWEFQEGSQSLLTEAEARLVGAVNSLLQEESSV